MNHSFLANYFEKTPLPQRESEVIAYLATLDHLGKVAPTVAEAILKEIKDQRTHLKLIASENFSSLSVQLAMGNLLTDKYSEGYPHHRFYAGCENVDSIEEEAVELAKKLFGSEHAYVQPHSGADANLVAFWAILTARVQNPRLQVLGKKNLDALNAQEFEEVRQLLCNQKFMGLSLGAGGHLTHGFRQNVSAKMMRAIAYDVDPKTGRLDYKQILTLAKREKPLILLAGYSAYPRRINFAKMREIADEVGAVLMVDMAHFAGLVAGKVFTGEESPVEYAEILTTTTHKTLRGPRGGIVLCNQEFATVVDKGCPLVLGGPLPHIIAAKAVALKEASSPDFEKYAQQVVRNAQALAEGIKKRGLELVTHGTDNHLIVIDLTSLNMTGRVGEKALRQGGITANRNTISSFDPHGAWYTSGIRLGTPSITTLGMKEREMDEIADIMVKILRHTESQSISKGETKKEVLDEAKRRVEVLLEAFPLYPQLLTF